MAKMSEKQDPPKPSVCENFEPQAWRKTVCKNCFQAPEKHMAGGGAASDSIKGSPGKQKTQAPAVNANEKDKPAPGKTPMTSGVEKEKPAPKSAASSLKDKYEQLEKDKHKPKEPPPKVAPKSKGPGGLSLLTNKYESISGPPTPGTPTTPSDKMEKPNIPTSKQGRLLDIKVSDRDSDEDVKSGKVIVNKLVKSKFGSIDNVSDTEEKSKFEVFQRSKFGSMENISIHNKKKEPIPIPIQKSKFGGSLENVSVDKRGSHSQNKAMDLLNKLDNFSIEIRSGATSNVGSTVIHQQEGGKVDIITIPIKRASAPNTPTADMQKPWSNKEAMQNKLNENNQTKDKETDGRLHLNVKKSTKTPSPERDRHSKLSIQDLKSPTPEKRANLSLKSPSSEQNSITDLKSPMQEKVLKAGLKSPTPDKDQKPDFKMKIEKPQLKSSKVENSDQHNTNEIVDLRAALKKSDSSFTDGSKVKNNFEIPTLKSTKTSNNKDPDTLEKDGDHLKAAGDDKNAKSNEILSKFEKKTSENDNSKTKFELPKLKSVRNAEIENNQHVSSSKIDKTEKKDPNFEAEEETKCAQNSLNNSDSTNAIKQITDASKVVDEGASKSVKGKDDKKELNCKTKQEPRDSDGSVKTDINSEKNNKNKSTVCSTESDKETDKSTNHKSASVDETKTNSLNKNSEKQSEDLVSKDMKKEETLSKEDISDDKNTDNKSKVGKEDELLPRFAKKDEKKEEPKPEENKPPLKSKFGKEEDTKSELLSRFAQKEDSKNDLRSKTTKPEEPKDALKSKYGKQEEGKPELLSRFAKKDEKKNEPPGNKIEDSKSGVKDQKAELLSRFAKKDERKVDPKSSKQEENKAGYKSKFGKQEEEKPELLSRFSKKSDSKNESKSNKPEESKSAVKTLTGKQESEKPELLSRFAKKNDKSTEKLDDRKKFGKETEDKPELFSRFAKKDEPKSKFEKKDDKKFDPKSKFGKTEEQSSELLSRFAKKDEKKTDNKANTGKQDGKQQNDKKVELVSKFGRKDENNKEQKIEEKKPDWKSKIGQKKEEKSELLSRFEKKQDEQKEKPDSKKPWQKVKTADKDEAKPEKDGKQSVDSVSRPEWKLKRDADQNAKKHVPEKKEEKVEEKKTDFRTKFEKPELKSTKSDEPQKLEKVESITTKSEEQHAKDKVNSSLVKSDQTSSEIKAPATSGTLQENAKPVTDTTLSEKEYPDKDFHSNKPRENENSSNTDKLKDTVESKNGPLASLSCENHFDSISTESEAVREAVNDACASDSANDDLPVHVDTQVFTSSRQKTAGVIGPDELESYAAASRIGLSDLHDSRSSSKTGDDKKLQNGDISIYDDTDFSKVKHYDNDRKKVDKQTEDLEKIRSELKLMVERCHNLEKENEQLLSGLEKKDSEVRDIKREKNDIETSVKTLQSKVKTMEDKCFKLESDNASLSNNLKTQQDTVQTNAKEKEEHDEKTTANDKIMADIVEENETLKAEINELKMEMDEMYDSFRDQEAEEFRELQRELEITAKNCRILQFKLRKLERHTHQLDQDKQHVEEKLRMLQNQFQDRDAVSHIHALEDELRMAKDVSVRLHDELDLLEDRRGKLEEENRHLTELLEQADRKQFRLEMEVDKLRDKIIEMKQELRQKEDPSSGGKLNCSEFLALHRDVI